MKITLNGDTIAIKNKTTLFQLLSDFSFISKLGIAVAINNRVVQKSTWKDYILSENDQVLIISATKGG